MLDEFLKIFLLCFIFVSFALGNTTIRTSLCISFCVGDCKGCQSPAKTRNNGQNMFPGDSSFGAFDLMDEWSGGDSFTRTFHLSRDGSCQKPTDQFTLPFGACVGPFGKPRPWGNFSLITTNEPVSQWERMKFVGSRGNDHGQDLKFAAKSSALNDQARARCL
jgi:hypothetical protein